MSTENKILMASAREALQGKWDLAIGATVIYIAIMVAVRFIPQHELSIFVSLIISGPLMLGFTSFMLSISRKEAVDIEQLFSGFKRFSVGLAVYLVMLIFIFLWTLLLIIPGIIAAYSYAMTFYILADDESIGAIEAITKSKEIMRGHKWKFFFLSCRFIGWSFLCILTLGIGFLWLIPYMKTSVAQFYDDIKNPVSYATTSI